MIHVCYMTNDGYCAPTAVSAVSVFENHRDEDVCVHVLTEFVSPENEKLLLQTAEPYPRGTVCLHNCDAYIRQIREEYRPTGWKGTCNAYLYMFMEEIFPDLDRILWIDGDTIIRRPLHELWQTDLEGKLLGGVLDVPAFTSAWPDDPFYHTPFYFNGGVLLFNLEECRRRHIDAVLQRWVKKHGARFRFPDQTLFNLTVRPEDVVRLPLRYDFPVGMSNRVLSLVAGYHMPEKPTFSQKSIQNERENAVIYHYIGGKLPTKPWFIECTIPGRDEYLHYRERSPLAGSPLKTLKGKENPAMLLLSRIYDTVPSARFSRMMYRLRCRFKVPQVPQGERIV